MLCQVPLILPDIHVIELGRILGLDLNLLSDFAAGKDLVTLKRAEDGPETAFIDLVPATKTFDHLPMGMGIFQVHVE
jgi:hypothetical protein